MRPWNAVATGAVLGGAGVAIRFMGDTIAAATGTSQGAFVDYGVLLDVVGLVLAGAGLLIFAYGVLSGVYTAATSNREEDAENNRQPTNSGSRTAPSSQQGRPRNRRRS